MPAGTTRPTIESILRRGVIGAAALRDALHVSQPTLSRMLAAAGSNVLRLGAARSTRYALRHNIGPHGTHWPLYRIDAAGRVHEVGQIHALEPSSWWFEASSPTPGWLFGEFAEGLFPGLPWFLDDLRPQGFMGRVFARTYGPPLGLDPDAARWSNDDVMTALLSSGDDLPGNFVIGDRALERAQAARPEWIEPRARARQYPQLADRSIRGELVGSSAGGEQPKFATWVGDPRDHGRSVLVKFSDRVGASAGRRWADLLICEHLAGEQLRDHDIPAAQTTIVEAGERVFLEVARFDRSGVRGRRGVVSLGAHDADYYGRHDSWALAADRLHADGWLASIDADRLRTLWWFGALIGNTDRHFANVSLMLEHGRPLTLAPSYDMLPMLYRPAASGEIVTREFEPSLAPPRERTHWNHAAMMAVAFWRRVSEDTRISRAFRRIAAANARVVAAAME